MWSENMRANSALVTVHGVSRSPWSSRPRPTALLTARSYTETVRRRTSCRMPSMSCFTNKLGGAWREIAAVFCPACCATIFSICRLARWTAPTGMPVSVEIAGKSSQPPATSQPVPALFPKRYVLRLLRLSSVKAHRALYRTQRAFRNTECDQPVCRGTRRSRSRNLLNRERFTGY